MNAKQNISLPYENVVKMALEGKQLKCELYCNPLSKNLIKESIGYEIILTDLEILQIEDGECIMAFTPFWEESKGIQICILVENDIVFLKEIPFTYTGNGKYDVMVVKRTAEEYLPMFVSICATYKLNR